MKNVSFVLLFLVFSLRIASAADNSLEENLRKNYVGSQQMLRHFYDSDALKFDSSGNPRNHGKEGPWTLLSGVMIDSLKLKSGHLELRGHRRMLVFDDQSKKLRNIGLPQTFWIEIETRDGQAQGAQLSAALAHVFVAPDDLVSVVPDYWRDYIARFTGKLVQGAPCADSSLKEDSSVKEGTDREGACKVSAGIVEGMKIYDVAPIYLPIARINGVQGGLALRAVIDKTGSVSRVCITQALGAGLDDMMVDAVRQWKYRPYMLNGQPIEVQTTVNGSFGIR
jgi:TonB family protein